MALKTVGARELKNRLSEYLRRVKAGETVLITDRGKLIGQLSPIQADEFSRVRLLAEAGLLGWNGQPVPPYQPKAVNQSNTLFSELVSEDRG
jgi:prevent-host-death family protein